MFIFPILLGSVLGVLAYHLLFKDNQDFKFEFDKEKENAIKGLVEKKQCQEKEMTEEIENSILAVKQELESLNGKFEQEQERYDAKVSALNSEFEKKQRQLELAEIENTKKIRDKATEVISEIESDKACEIERIKVDYDRKKKGLSEDFLAYSADINLKREKLANEIEVMENQKSALVERLRKEQELKDNIDFYHISLDTSSKHDIVRLKELALSFSKPAAIYKVIWESFYKTPMEALFKKILGENLNRSGIYKITELGTEKTYVGKATDLQKRWREHAKQGCGIDKTNILLYDAMMEKGLEQFCFEVIEICKKEELAEKEKYWIKFYKSNEVGYNQKVG